jgi:uncharacterized membrane protein YfcA
MLSIYLPIAEQSVSAWALLAVGGGVGLLSGIFGVGGGFLLTPLLMFLGIPPAVAVSTGACQVLGSSVSGVIAHWRRGNVDLRMGLLMLVGGLIGSGLGVWLFARLKAVGQVDLAISLAYVGFLGVVGGLMLVESLHAAMGAKTGRAMRKHHLPWHAWPLRLRFPRSRLYISAIPPVAMGMLGGMLAAIMGVGGGFIMVPLMIYGLGMPTAVVVGTSLFQIIFVTAGVTWLQSVSTHTVDVVLALVLLAGGVVGAQFGARLGTRLKAEQLRLLLALLVLAVSAKMAWDLMIQPADLYTLAN